MKQRIRSLSQVLLLELHCKLSVGEPIRMCVSCRKRSEKHELARLVWNGGQVEHDKRSLLPGRGCYVHPDRGCINQLLVKDRLWRALRLEKTVYPRLQAAEFVSALGEVLCGSSPKVEEPSLRGRKVFF